ncbi:chondroitin sulfate synthase 2-like [Limulus polyphemus]|uniref:Hexosyltransferase n=1 Tax=Limulus polyphemus TaxID=6850 RepID=A0ABM1BBF6_LIMPO|nr:chondroitin sulfate synthase 2-like [Limulus polyphemus]
MNSLRIFYTTFLKYSYFFLGLSLGIGLAVFLSFTGASSNINKCLPNAYILRENTAKGWDILENFDDYEPIIDLQRKPNKPPQHQEKLNRLRPRYYSTELSIKEKLFVGIITNPQTVNVLGVAFNRTLSKHVKTLVYFLKESHPENLSNIFSLQTIIGFKDVSGEKVQLHILKYILDTFVNEYDFFFLVRDTTYVRGSKLLDFVNHLSISQDVYTGHVIHDEIKLNDYCSLNGGLLLSNSVIKKVGQSYTSCLKQSAFSNSQDALGRCITYVTGMSCRQEVQGKTFHAYVVNKDVKKTLQDMDAVDPKDFHVVFPVYNSKDHYQIHKYFSEKELSITHYSIKSVEEHIVQLAPLVPGRNSSVTWPLGLEPHFKPESRFDVISWNHFNGTHKFLDPTDPQVVSRLVGVKQTDTIAILNDCLQWLQKKYGKVFSSQVLENGYWRIDPTRGMEYLMDIKLLNNKQNKIVQKRLEIVRPLNKIEIIPVPYVTEHTRIALVTVVKADEITYAKEFLSEYEVACLEKQENSALLLVFLYGPNDPGKGSKDDVFGQLKSLISFYNNRYRAGGAKIAWLSVKTDIREPPDFAVMDLVCRKLTPESIVLLGNLKMEIRTDYLNRVRMNTILGFQVFFPIPFVQYHPKVQGTTSKNFEIKKDLGHFDIHSYQSMSFYISDYIAARTLIKKEVPFVKTDRDLKNERLYNLEYGIFDMFVRSKLCHVLRAIEPELRIKYRTLSCSLDLNHEAYQQCLHSKKESLGSKSQLAKLILKKEMIQSEQTR